MPTMENVSGPGNIVQMGTQQGPFPGNTYDYEYISGFDLSFASGRDTPSYNRRRRSGDLLPITNWIQCFQSGSTSGSWTTSNTASGSVYTGSTFYFGLSGQPIAPTHAQLQGWADEYMDTEYIHAALAKLYGSGWDALTWAAELRSTIGMFNGLVDRLKNLLSSRDVRDWASAWAEGRYGWRTLIFDMQDIQSALLKLGQHRPKFSRATAGANASITSISTVTLGDTSAVTYEWSMSHEVSLSLRGYVGSKIAPPIIRFDLLPTAWELVKWSFVIDWIVDIGVVLQALSGSQHHTDLVSSLGAHLIVQSEGSVINTTGHGPWTGSVASHSSVITEYTIRVPRSADFIPSFRLNLNGYKVADLVSFILQRK